jgi:cytochrome c-type biogenesis protein CcmH
MSRIAAVVAATLLLAPVAVASERHPTLSELEDEVMCPVCGTTLAESSSPAAKQIERDIQGRIRAGWTKSRIKDELVRNYGQAILASPPARGFNLLAWVLPLAGIGVAALLLGWAAWRWSRGRVEEGPPLLQSPNGRRRLDPELERRVDEELARLD